MITPADASTLKPIIRSALLWQWLSSILFTMLGTGWVTWWTFGSEKVTHAEMQEYVARSTPYAQDKSRIEEFIKQFHTLEARVDTMRDEQVRNTTKIDLIENVLGEQAPPVKVKK